jgi:chromosome segregation ATPase
VLLAGILAVGSAANVTSAQGQLQPVVPSPKVMSLAEQERQFDAQARQLEARRTELERGLQQTEVQLQQLVLQQDQQRRGLQTSLDEIRGRLRDVNSQLADLPRQRLRARYLAALQTLEQARVKRQQAEQQAEAARQAEQEAALAAERLRQALEQTPSTQPEPVVGPPLLPPPAGTGAQGPGEGQKPDQPQGQGLPLGPQAVDKPMIPVEQPGCAWSQPREEQGGTIAQTDSLLPQLESLRGEIRRAGEQMKVLAAQTDASRESVGREIAVVRTDLQRMGRTLGRIEQERLKGEGGLKAGVEELRRNLAQVQQQVSQTQQALYLATLQAQGSTVGSAAYW